MAATTAWLAGVCALQTTPTLWLLYTSHVALHRMAGLCASCVCVLSKQVSEYIELRSSPHSPQSFALGHELSLICKARASSGSAGTLTYAWHFIPAAAARPTVAMAAGGGGGGGGGSGRLRPPPPSGAAPSRGGQRQGGPAAATAAAGAAHHHYHQGQGEEGGGGGGGGHEDDVWMVGGIVGNEQELTIGRAEWKHAVSTHY